MNKAGQYFSYLKKIKKIPIMIGVLLILISLVIGIFLVGYSRNYFSKGSTQNSPQEIKITNISDVSFTVSWFTQDKSIGLVYYGQEPSVLVNIAKDVRDRQINNPRPYFTHYVVVENLQPQKKYFFQIFSDQKIYNNSGKPYEVTTAPKKTPPESDITQGKIINKDFQPVDGAVVYLSIANTTMQSSLTDQDGSWMIPLSNARTSDLQNFSSYDKSSQIIEIFVRGEGKYSNTTLSTDQDNPSPDIILGENQNFLQGIPTAIPLVSLTIPGNLGSGSSPSASFESSILSIIYPTENEKINSFTPQFFGRGPKFQKLDVSLESDLKTIDQTNVDSQGKWQFTPQKPLFPGSYRLTVSYTNNQGFLESVSRNFTILNTGESNLPAFTATKSAEISTSPSPTMLTPTLKPSPTTTTTSQKTPTPSTIPLSSTITPTLVKSPTPTTDQTRTTMPSTSSGEYKSGTTIPTAIFGIVGGAILILGIVLLVI